MKLTENFSLEEFIPKEIYTQFGDSSLWFLDPRLPVLVQAIRDMLGKPITINGNGNNYCGFRPKNCTVGADNSQHRFGRAADLHMDMDYEKARQFIRDSFKALNLLGLTTIEKDTGTWLHIDMRWTDNKELLEVNYY